MNNEESDKKINEYSERLQFWTNQAITQFGVSLNLFYVTGVGFLAYLVGESAKFRHVSIHHNAIFDFDLTFYLLAVLLTLLSVVMGSISVVSRLHDLRLTRHTIWIRYKCAKEIKELLPDDFIDSSSITLKTMAKAFISTIFTKKYFIKDTDIVIENLEQLKRKIGELKRRNIEMGQFSWLCHKGQIIFISLAGIFYSLVLLT